MMCHRMISFTLAFLGLVSCGGSSDSISGELRLLNAEHPLELIDTQGFHFEVQPGALNLKIDPARQVIYIQGNDHQQRFEIKIPHKVVLEESTRFEWDPKTSGQLVWIRGYSSWENTGQISVEVKNELCPESCATFGGCRDISPFHARQVRVTKQKQTLHENMVFIAPDHRQVIATFLGAFEPELKSKFLVLEKEEIKSNCEK